MRKAVGRVAILLASPVLFPDAGEARAPQHVSSDRHVAHTENTKPSKAAVELKHNQRFTATEAEAVEVRGGMRTANGVTNTTPGGGLMARQTAARSQSTITRDFIAKQSPTGNAIAMISALPGVISASTDPLGQSNTAMSIRGLQQAEIGFVYEGIPLNDSINYTPYTQAMVDTDNIQSVTVAQGAPDIGAPVYNDVGGLVTVALRDPLEKRGGNVDFSFGSKALQREFIRLDSGEIGHSRVKAFASFSSTTNDQWRGSGKFRKYHVDSKIIKEWGSGSSAGLTFSYDNWQQASYRPMTMAQWRQYGNSFNYTKEYYPGNTNWVGLHLYQRRSTAIIAPVKLKLSEHVSLDVTPAYMNYSEFYYGGVTLKNRGSYFGDQQIADLNLPYQTNGVTTASSINPVPQKSGFLNAALTWKAGRNTFRAGYIYNYIALEEPIYYAAVNYTGGIANNYSKYMITMPDGRQYRTLDMNFKHQMNELFIDDTLKFLDDKITVEAGLRYLMISRWNTNLIPGATRYKVGASYAQPLPQVSISYQITPHDQIYIDGTTAYRAPASVQVYGEVFSTTSPTPASRQASLKGEYSIGEEIGYRHYGLVNLSVSLFNYNITNNQITSSQYINGIPLPSPIEAGGKTSRGAQAEIGLRPWRHWSPYVSAQYLHATTDNNIASGLDYLPTKGKIAVQSPEFSAAAGISYDDGHIFGNFVFNYVSSQYSTLMDDEKIPGYETANMTLGYRMRSIGFAQHPQIQLNVINIGAKNYLSGFQSISNNAKATRGVYGTTIAGSSPLYLSAGGVAAVASLSTAF
ncbi:TonB-dependent receptor [Acetobacter sp. DsW_063]|uniref:TonB-dependent receptor n=1 Tax=Acetobacter sp. DsW_063 TaxID=1514894 RepID=UPI000A365BB3|nr:TonB-dependent receptor [Acetobacter sp. DsW_063]OUJ15295.1 TonB-dependent receptor [Acetobacter sp. DsW_063]